MKHLLSIGLLMCCLVFGSAQEAKVKGKILSQESRETLAGIQVQLQGKQATTNGEGDFHLDGLQVGNWFLTLTGSDYERKEIALVLNEGMNDLGEIFLSEATHLDDVPVISLSLDDEASESGGNISGLLNSSSDIFVSTAGYKFGPARFRMRGYDSRYTQVMVNGIEMNDMERGRPIWAIWGGLNDVTRNKEIVSNGNYSTFSLGNIGGVTNIDTRPTSQRTQTKISYANSNRSYTNRLMVAHSTGMLDNGWAFTVSGSRRWAQEGYIEGTFYDAWAYFVAAEKRINDRHSLALTIFASPNERGGAGGAPQAFYDMNGSNFYNAAWGYQDGEKRNAKVSNSHQPQTILNHYWKVNDKLNINTALSYSFGKYKKTYLSWYDAKDPRPTYYRNLDYNASDSWTTTGAQINWDYVYQTNQDEFFTVENANGIEGNTYTGIRSQYFIEEKVTDHKMYNFNTNLNYNLSDNLDISGGLGFRSYSGEHYKEMNDLLGGEFWVDIDKFAERDAIDPDQAQNNLLTPNRIIKEGDKFNYDWYAHINKYNGWAQAKYQTSHFDVNAGIKLSQTSFYREGMYQKGLFKDNSLGDSEKQNFTNYMAKAGLTYKPTGRHYFVLNAQTGTIAPYFINSMLSSNTRNQFVDNLESEEIISGDLSYYMNIPGIKARLTAFYTQFNNQTDVRSFYHDGANAYVNRIMTGIDKTHQGIEFGLQAKVLSDFTISAVASLGDYRYSSRPNMTLVQDNKQEVIDEQVVYVKNFYEAGTPQNAYNLSIKYNAPKFWWIEVAGNYYDNSYLSFNPIRRTAVGLSGIDPNTPAGEEPYKKVYEQEKLPSAFIMEITGGKSWRIDYKYYISLFANVSNVLDNKEFITGGYESNRFDVATKDLNKFPSTYFYSYGRNYFITLSFRF